MIYPTLAHFRHLSHFRHFKHSSTTVEIALQISSFLTNKPNFPHFSPKNDDFTKNKPNSNPIQSQFDERVKLMQSVYLQRIMKKNTEMGQKNKAKTNPIQSQLFPLNDQINIIYQRIFTTNDIIILNL